jgi:hypothetical protein
MAFNWGMMIPGLINAAGQNVGSQAGRASARAASGAFNVMDQKRRAKLSPTGGPVNTAPSGVAGGINPGFKLPPSDLLGMASGMFGNPLNKPGVGAAIGGGLSSLMGRMKGNTGITGGMGGGLPGLWGAYQRNLPPVGGGQPMAPPMSGPAMQGGFSSPGMTPSGGFAGGGGMMGGGMMSGGLGGRRLFY